MIAQINVETFVTVPTNEAYSESVGSYLQFLKLQEKIEPYICECGCDKMQRLLKYHHVLIYRCCKCYKKIKVKKSELFLEEKFKWYKY